mgnify:CR=1 FL=1
MPPESAAHPEPTPAELARRQDQLEKQQRDQWGRINDNRDRVAAAEAGMERLWSELHTFRTEVKQGAEANRKEAHEDTQMLAREIRELGEKIGKKADQVDVSRIDKLADSVNVRRGGLRLAAWIIGAGIPAAAAVVAGVYYLGEILKSGTP